MADFVTAGTQTVEVNASVLFAANRIYSCNCPNIRHEPLSGRVVLLPGLYRVGFNGNFSAAAAGDVILSLIHISHLAKSDRCEGGEVAEDNTRPNRKGRG